MCKVLHIIKNNVGAKRLVALLLSIRLKYNDRQAQGGNGLRSFLTYLFWVSWLENGPLYAGCLLTRSEIRATNVF